MTNTTTIPVGDDWESSLLQAFGVLLGRPLAEYDHGPGVSYGTFYGGNFLEESELDRDPAWLTPAALRGEETVTVDGLILLDEVGVPELRFDPSRSYFTVESKGLPDALARELDALDAGNGIRGDALAGLLERHGFDLTSPDAPAGAWRISKARIASDGTLLGALRAATALGDGPASIVPHAPSDVLTGTEEEGDEVVAPIAHDGLRSHLRSFGEPGSHTLDFQAGDTWNRSWTKWQADQWDGLGSLVTQWLGAVDQYEVSVVRLTEQAGDGPTA
ncbi:hypothetical protein PV726_35160 [Streptomyces europaeiscabiei]|uniref:hypothetical protein n=1 Tax=Streptomyces europaeiscabiei TaxID=146819 RepID=UPI00299F9AEF|nr:hypothetical protein [Streptomyces europaeiscabiei]MDX3695487.1 hypothetical protein [Streptomyces europaeiscabiei]